MRLCGGCDGTAPTDGGLGYSITLNADGTWTSDSTIGFDCADTANAAQCSGTWNSFDTGVLWVTTAIGGSPSDWYTLAPTTAYELNTDKTTLSNCQAGSANGEDIGAYNQYTKQTAAE